MDETRYQEWRKTRLANYPQSIDELCVDIGGLRQLGKTGREAVLANCRRANMAIYRCRDRFADPAALLAFGANFGLVRPDHHLCAGEHGVAELAVAAGGIRSGYVPYSSHSLSWHTDGYYNDLSLPVRAVILHCIQPAASGGENALLDPEIAYILLRDENPQFVTALEHPECMSIPANRGEQGEIRPAVCGPVFSRDPRSGALHMRYSARQKNILWRDDAITRSARDFLTGILAAANGPLLRYRLQAGEGIISNNVLHNRTGFEGGPPQRMLYRVRYHDRIESG